MASSWRSSSSSRPTSARRCAVAWLAAALSFAAAPAWAAVAVEGTVFVDRDANGLYSAGDDPVPGAVVFFETAMYATTDAAGRYTLSVPGDGMLWVRTPDGYSPEPSWRLVGASSGAVTADLELEPAKVSGPVVFVAGADSHLGLMNAALTKTALDQATDLDPPPHFMTILGDIGNLSQQVEYDALREAWGDRDIPLVPVPGNHDWDDGGTTYRKNFGPPQYSFDSGGVHFVILNSMASATARADFLARDLALPHAGGFVVVFQHYAARDGVAEWLADAGVDYAFTGHEHANRAPQHLGLKEYNTETLVMGGGEMTPAGYRVARREGAVLRVTHHTTVNDLVLELIFPRPGSCAQPGEVPVLAAVETGASEEQVSLTIQGQTMPLAAAGGWLHTGTVTLPAGDHQGILTASGGRSGPRQLTRDLCVRAADPAPAVTGEWPQLQGGSEHQGAIAERLPPPLRTLWARPVGGHLLHGSPVLSGGRLFVPVVDLADESKGGVVALDARTGDLLWAARPGPAVRNAPAVAGGKVVFVTADGWLHAVDAATGAPAWDVDFGLGLWAHAAPAVVDGQVLVSLTGRFSAFDPATGAELWLRDPASMIFGGVSMSSVTAGGGLAVTPYPDGRDGLVGWTLADGVAMWRVALPLARTLRASPVLDGDTVYAGNVEGTVFALDVVTGMTRWTRQLYRGNDLGDGIVGTPALANGRLFVPTPRDRFHALDAETGEPLWSVEAGATLLRPVPYHTGGRLFLSSPVVTGDLVWFGGADGVLRVADVDDGEVRWSEDLGGALLSGLVPSPPYLFVGSFDGTIRAMIHDEAAVEQQPDDGCSCRVAPARRSPPPAGWLLAALALALVRRRR